MAAKQKKATPKKALEQLLAELMQELGWKATLLVYEQVFPEVNVKVHL